MGTAAVSALLLMGSTVAAPAEAATITVTTASDSVANDGACSLREAIISANGGTAGDCPNGGAADVITLSGSNYKLTGVHLNVQSSVTIEGNGATISAGSGARVFSVSAGASLTLNNLTVSGGTATLGGGILNAGTLNLNKVTVSDNTASESGGGLHNEGTVTIRDSKFLRNEALGLDGGGLHSNDGTIAIFSSEFADNTAERNGGGIGTRFTDVTMHPGTRIVRNTTGFSGGGFSNILGHYEVRGAVVGGSAADGNRAQYGGGVDTAGSDYTATLILRESTVSHNVAEFAGGGFYTFEDTVVIENSLIANNRSTEVGGAIFNDRNDLTVENSTFSGNHSNLLGGAIFGFEDRRIDLFNVTITGNSAPSGGGIDTSSGLDALIINTIIAGNSGGDCIGGFDSGSIHNLAGPSCDLDPSNNVVTENAGLGALANNGGPTLTHALLGGSPAVNAGDNATCQNITKPNDQRGAGFARIVDNICDIGAFEANNPGAGTAAAPAIYQPQTRPNMSGAIEHIVAPRPTGILSPGSSASGAPAASAPSTAAAGTGTAMPMVRPPSTGDGGLLH